MNKSDCKTVLCSNDLDFCYKVSKLLDAGYKIVTARYECYISNFIWYAILIKECCE